MRFNTGLVAGKRCDLLVVWLLSYATASMWPRECKGRANINQTAMLLFSEYICLAIMSFPYSYATLGLVPGLILTVVVAAMVLYTSLIVW